MNYFGRFGAGTEVVASSRGAVLGFRLRGVFTGDGFTAGLVADFGGA